MWSNRMAKADKEWSDFCRMGDEVIDRYRLERSRSSNQNQRFWKDKYNILYSSTETMRPSLYAQTPKPEVNPRVKDTTDERVVLAANLLENCIAYSIEDLKMDAVMKNVVSDFMLPGIGVAWLRFGADFVTLHEGETEEDYSYNERFELDYVHYKDFRCSGGRVWEDVWWVAKRCYLFREQAKKRFGPEKAALLSYSHKPESASASDNRNNPSQMAEQAIVWEIWDKRTGEVLWWSSDAKDILDRKADPLKLRNFFPCPEPLRAVFATDRFMPQSFFSQYRQQAETLDDITMRIRILTKALRVVGVFDASQEALSRLLTGDDNKMVPVENWAQFASTGGMEGSVQFLPIQEVAQVLLELYKQREIAKNEIYELTGFSDIIRGTSKASETLGAQKIKNEWATGRVRSLQMEVQRFCRDIIEMMGEIIAEHFSDESIALYSGFNPPPITPEEQAAVEQAAAAALQGQPVPPPPPTQQQQAIAQFKAVLQLLREEKLRCASIGIETDSTIEPDQSAEREDRMQFLAAMGAYLQQAAPMAMQYPQMAPFLGAMMMFTARTFRASRPLEKAFEQFQQQFQASPPAPPEGEGGDNGAGEQAKAQAAIQQAQIEAQAAQQGQQAEIQARMQEKQMELQAKADLERYKVDREMEYKMAELRLREREVAVKEAELGIKREDMEHKQEMAEVAAAQADEKLEVDAQKSAQPTLDI